MRITIVIGFFVASMSLVHVVLATDAAVIGKWQTEASDTGGRAYVQIELCGDKICGTIVNAIDGDGAVVADYEHLGKQMIAGMNEKSPGIYTGGTIWAPDRNKTYRSRMKLISNGKLVVKGCVAFICRSQTWTRINDVLQSQSE